MVFKNILKAAGFFCCMGLFFCQNGLAEDPHFLSVYHSEYGLKLYNDGKVDGALERFTKALLLDPQNKTAKDALHKIAGEIVPASNPRVLRISRFVDQIDYYNFLKTRCENLTAENSRLFDFVNSNTSLGEALNQKAQEIKSRQADRIVSLPSIGLIGFSLDEGKAFDLDDIVSRLSRQRELLASEIDFWEQQNKELRSLRGDILEQKTNQASSVIAERLKSRLSEIENRVEQKDNLLATQHQNIEYFQSELSNVRENFDLLQKRLQNTDAKIAQLTKKLADMSMEIIEKNKTLDEKNTYTGKLQKEINEANEKMNLATRIMQEKDQRIALLENEMSGLKQAVRSSSAASNPELAQLKEDFKVFEEQLKAQMGKSRERVIGLEIQLIDLTDKYETLVRDLQVKDSQIAFLKSASSAKDLSIDYYRNALLTTNQKAMELSGMLDIYRVKLAQTTKALMAKQSELDRSKGSQIQQAAPGQGAVDAGNEELKTNLSDGLDLTFLKKIDRLLSD